MLENFTSRLAALKPVSIAEIENVALLNRVDRKFVLTEDELESIIPCLIDHYYILEINDIRIFSYENNYFDTPDLQFFRDHHNGYVNRIKVRTRKYVETDMCFFEIKKKEKVERTNKHRESVPEMFSDIDEERINMIQYYSNKNIKEIHLVLKNNFHRVTLVNNSFTERVTIDMDLHFINDKKDVDFGRIAIIEIKQDKGSTTSPLTMFLKQNTIRKQSISKYIYGVISLNESVKKNNFMPMIKKINKLQHYGTNGTR
ncbi:MAG: polyphosphate polymerase domain-containing protein [Flavobacterium sp.]|nr:polyphosphate polymerase domain-containing protein [Flavobacterium sp.]